MDLLFSKYASPFLFMDEVIKGEQFMDFVNYTISQENEKTMWEMWLHKVFDKDFDDFKKSIGATEPIEKTSDEQLETTVKTSAAMMQNFIPEE